MKAEAGRLAGLSVALLFAAGCGTANTTPVPSSISTGTVGPTESGVGSSPSGTSAGPSAGPSGTELASGGPGSTGADVISAEGDVEFGPGTFDMPVPAAGLDGLSSYKARLVLSFAGTSAGQRSEWSTTYEMLATSQQPARQLTIQGTGQPTDTDPPYMAEMSGAAYQVDTDGNCTARAVEPGQTLAERMEPAGFLTGLFGAEEAGSETVNGIAAARYTFDERALAEGGSPESEGQLWVAADAGYLVKYALTTTAGGAYFGPGIDGVLTWAYDVSDVNQGIGIELPADCPAGMIDAPSLPDATAVFAEPGVLSYSTPSSPAEVAAFYQDRLPTLGWQANPQPVIQENGAILDFTRADEHLSVFVTVGEAGTNVLLALEPTTP
jgi:hypothetical protein